MGDIYSETDYYLRRVHYIIIDENKKKKTKHLDQRLVSFIHLARCHGSQNGRVR
jgi:hypothetical protein